MTSPFAASKESWTAYRALLDLERRSESDPDVREARKRMIADPFVALLVAGLLPWPGDVVNSHKSSWQPFHRLAFLADIGLTKDDPGMAAILAAILASSSAGIPTLPMVLSKGPQGSAEARHAWALCDAPVTLRALVGMGLRDDPAVRSAAAALIRLGRENGWPCALAPEAGGWRGPGRKQDPCPYATLAMLKLAAEFDVHRDGAEARAGVASLLGLWEHSRERHPYIFYMGTDFRKLKVPFVWYDILHVADVLSRFPAALGDPRFRDMIGVITSKRAPDGTYSPESDWKAWADHGLANKGKPSDWLGFLVRRIENRLKEAHPDG